MKMLNHICLVHKFITQLRSSRIPLNDNFGHACQLSWNHQKSARGKLTPTSPTSHTPHFSVPWSYARSSTDSNIAALQAGTTLIMSNPAKAPAPGTGPGLLDLPAEIRNHIYTLALAQDHPVLISTYGRSNRASLLRVNRQIRSEASQIYYSINTFRATIDDAMIRGPIRWSNGMSATSVKAIQSFTLVFEPSEDFDDHLHDEMRKGWPHWMERQGLTVVLPHAVKTVDKVMALVDELVTTGVPVGAIRFEDDLDNEPGDVKLKEQLLMRLSREVREGVERRVNAEEKYDGLQIVEKQVADEV